MDYVTIALSLLGLMVFVIVGFFTFVFLRYIVYMEHKLKIAEAEQYKDIDIEKINKILDDLISITFNEYQKFHPELTQPDSYIKGQDIQPIITELTALIYDNITPAIRFNLSLAFDISTQEKMINLIGERVGILVMAMAVTVNSSIVDDTSTISIDV